ncbi:TonB-dependent receptor [uncultured Polaribacter sp.]|uniref:SusC/RagA family TonB-linked outer membrane protein n=1 Tax=uncultured Polaribacter sp. TaxID=174711 RepID=UPI0026147973|nr:TonB-dependent receptor [uncultured Polaribacter sp.]
MKGLLYLYFLITVDSYANFSDATFYFFEPVQKRTIKGVVVDDEEIPLPGATVLVKGTKHGVTTDFDGKFLLKIDASSKVLVVSYIGYELQEVEISEQADVYVKLVRKLNVLNEVVIDVGYKSQIKENITSAVATISGAEIEKRAVTQSSQVLQGMAAGVFVNGYSGEPGNDSAEIQIRGLGLNYSGPLVLVDGIESNINDVEPNNIQSISVLKDAASTAIYGTRGADGVILITTKSGSYQEKTKTSYDGYYGISNPTVIPQLVWDNRRYLELYREAALNSNLNPDVTYFDINRYDELPATNWMDVVIKGNASVTKHNLSFRGGGKNTKYYVSTNYLHQNGYLIDETYFKRLSNRINLKTKLSKKLSFSANMAYTKEKIELEPKYGTTKARSTQDIGGTIWSGGFVNHPNVPVYDSQGRYGSLEDALGIIRSRPNPVAVAENELSLVDRDVLRGKWTLSYEPFTNLIFSANVGLDYNNSTTHTSKNEYNIYDPVSGEVEAIHNRGHFAMQEIFREFTTTFWIQSDYKFSFANHNFDILLGLNGEHEDRWTQNVRETEFSVAESVVIDLGAEQDYFSQRRTESAINSAFSRLSYNYKKRYLFEVNYRIDGSSRFGKNSRWATFPAISAGWMVSNESFLKNNKIVSFAKLRASWGIVGKQSSNRFPFISTLSLSQSFNDAPGVGISRYGNPSIEWMEATTKDVGLELGFFRNRLSVEIDYFDKITDNIIAKLNAPNTSGTGNSTYLANAASVRNSGLEFLVNFRTKIGAVKFAMSGNFTSLENEVITIDPNLSDIDDKIVRSETTDDNDYIIRGVSMNAIWGHKQDGIFQEDDFVDVASGELVAGIPDHSFIGSPRPGDFKYTDQNGDGRITKEDQTVIGNRHPKYYYGGSISLSYKGFQLSGLLQGMGKADVFISRSYGPFPYAGIREFWEENRWTSENPSNEHPRLWLDRYGYNAQSIYGEDKVLDYWVHDRSYLRLKNVRLAYSFPKKLTKKMQLSKLMIYASGQNLWTKTNLLDLDPERYARESHADNALPQNKTYLVGIKVSL